MNYSFKRHINTALIRWKNQVNRKPLILRGARQVGKTTLVNQFSNHYRHYISLNLERAKDLSYFTRFSDAQTIVEVLFLAHKIPSEEKSYTLLFIDEIQESPEAISLLRYFYEDEPELHLIAAGSLLEHVMHRVKSFPVGRVQFMYLHPLNFSEYLWAKQHEAAHSALQSIPVAQHAHPVLKDLFHEYAMIGGMPEVVKAYLSNQSLSDLASVYESIWSTYKDDVEKYAHNTTDVKVIKHIMNVAHLYLDQRIKFQNFGKSNYKSREVGEAMRSLNDARVIQLIYPATNVSPPIQPDLKKSPRLQFLDTGLVNYELNIQGDMLGIDDLSPTYKGALIPHLITQELISLNTAKYKRPHFWVREKTQSSSEVDLMIQYKDKVIPVEIKSGKEGTLKSLHQFIEKSNHPYAVRMYAGEFKVEKHYTPGLRKEYLLMNIPYYLGTLLSDYIAYFINNYTL